MNGALWVALAVGFFEMVVLLCLLKHVGLSRTTSHFHSAVPLVVTISAFVASGYFLVGQSPIDGGLFGLVRTVFSDNALGVAALAGVLSMSIVIGATLTGRSLLTVSSSLVFTSVLIAALAAILGPILGTKPDCGCDPFSIFLSDDIDIETDGASSVEVAVGVGVVTGFDSDEATLGSHPKGGVEVTLTLHGDPDSQGKFLVSLGSRSFDRAVSVSGATAWAGSSNTTRELGARTAGLCLADGENSLFNGPVTQVVAGSFDFDATGSATVSISSATDFNGAPEWFESYPEMYVVSLPTVSIGTADDVKCIVWGGRSGWVAAEVATIDLGAAGILQPGDAVLASSGQGGARPNGEGLRWISMTDVLGDGKSPAISATYTTTTFEIRRQQTTQLFIAATLAGAATAMLVELVRALTTRVEPKVAGHTGERRAGGDLRKRHRKRR